MVEDALKTIAKRVKNYAATMQTEEAVKTAVVLPFLNALGYDVFNPMEVIPEFTADTVGKKGEKVDYAIRIDDEIRILTECKPISCELETRHLNQLYRYFSVTNAKFAILTNGKHFRFYTDLDEKNKLDSKPFFIFDITEYNPNTVSELKKFAKASFDISNILLTAERLKYTSGIKQNIINLIENPTEQLVRLLCTDVYEGRLTTNVMEMLLPITKNAFREVISDAVKNRLSSALKDTTIADEKAVKDAPASEPDIITTEEQIEAFMIVKAIAREVIAINRIFLRDAKSYCSIFIDDNNRKPLVRLHFNRTVKQIGFFDTEVEEKVDIKNLDDIYGYAERIHKAAEKYL